ncbi:MAG: hypothetical protein KA419_11665 [Acidobacteria bacterium]|nr:hypothetical protein [Acidobacteriota bacterium]
MKETRKPVLREEAVRCWNDLLSASPGADAVIDHLLRKQKHRGLTIGVRPFCMVGRPRFVTVGEMRREHQAVSVLSRAVRKVRDAVLADQKLHADYLGGFNEWIGTILALEPKTPEIRSILRFDSFTTGEGIRFVELNGDIPMGSVGNDGLVPLFQRLDFYKAFETRYEVWPNLIQVGMVQTFVHAWQAWGGAGTPRMCMLSFAGGVQDRFAHLNARYLKKMGFEAVLAHPGDLDFSRGKLRVKGRAIDLVYRLMHTDDCLERAEEIAPLLQAVRQRAICLVNPFRSELLSHKYLFALLTDDRHDFGFTREEVSAIREHIPWGRILRDGRSSGPDGKTVDLLEYVQANKDDLVLKPAHAAGGSGVFLGWNLDGSAWEKALREALAGEYVVQQRVGITRECYPLLEKGFPLVEFYEDTDPFHFPGGYSAVLSRISSAEITNVSQGGSIVPTFVIDAR